MKRQIWTLSNIFGTLIICIAVNPSMFGQDVEPGRVEATGMVGVLTGIGTHGMVGGSIAAAIRNRFSVIGELSYIPLGSDTVDVLGVRSEFSAKAISFNFGGQYQLQGSRKMSPYVGAGVGFLHSSSSSSVTTTFQGFEFENGSSETNAYLNLGGGARYHVNDRWGFKPELMLFLGHQTFVRASAGIFYQFGK
jgi:opacity protein-like surface antigen